jgi:hypothetical protein
MGVSHFLLIASIFFLTRGNTSQALPPAFSCGDTFSNVFSNTLPNRDAPSIRLLYALTPPTLSSSSASQIAECSPKFRRHSAAIGQLRANPQLPPPTCRRERRSTPSLALVGSRPLGVVPADPVRSPLASRPYIPPELACVRASGNGSVLGGSVSFTSGCTFCATACQSKLFANM